MNWRSVFSNLHVVLVVLSALFAAVPLFAPGYFSFAHDGRHSVFLLQMFDSNIREGVLVPRWGADVTFGYGYPVWIIFAPLPYYAAELFHLIGFDFVWSVKLVYVCAIIGSALAMYLFASTILGKDAGVIAAVAYTFIPYHIVDIYVRAAWPETISFVYLPLILWGLHQVIETRRIEYIALTGLSYGALILTHILSWFIFSLVIGVYLIYRLILRIRQRDFSLSLLSLPAISLALGICVGALFLIPSLLEQPYLSQAPFTGSFFDFRKHFITIAQMLSPFWGYGYAGTNGDDQFSLQIGIAPLALAVFALVNSSGKEDGERRYAWFFAVITFASLIGTLQVSQPIWELVSRAVAFVQFPWRLLTVSAFGLAFLCAVAASTIKDRAHLFAVAFLLVLSIFPNAHPQYTTADFSQRGLMEFEMKDRELLGDTVWLQGERPTDSPLTGSYLSGTELKKVVVLEGDATIQMLEHRATSDKAVVTSNGEGQILFLTHYFPGWSIYIDGIRAGASDWEIFGEQGLMLVHIPAGTHIVEARFGETLPRIVGEVITGVSLVVTVLMVGWRGSRGKKSE